VKSALNLTGFRLQIPCHTHNYQISLINNIYNLNISRILPVDILVLIAAIVCHAWKTEIEYILKFFVGEISTVQGN